MAKPPSLLERVRGEIPSKGPRPIMERIPADLAAEMREVRDAWRAGKDPLLAKATKTGLGKLLTKHLRERGIVIGDDAVIRWLTEN